VLSLVGLDRTVAVYPSLDTATAARPPAAAGARAEDVPGGSGDIAAAQQANLQILDAVITGLFPVRLSLQAALDLPADPARKRIEEALDDLDDVIREIRDTVFTARDRPVVPLDSQR
jgi:hypothetical protein